MGASFSIGELYAATVAVSWEGLRIRLRIHAAGVPARAILTTWTPSADLRYTTGAPQFAPYSGGLNG